MKKKNITRLQFRERVFKRDGHQCLFCDETEEVAVHPITECEKMPYSGYVIENGITLCNEHQEVAERYQLTDGKAWGKNMHPDDLYAIIGSSYDIAVQASEEKLGPYEDESK